MRGPIFERLESSLDARQLVALATVVGAEPADGPIAIGAQLLLGPQGPILGGLGEPTLDAHAARIASEQWTSFGARRETVSVAPAAEEVQGGGRPHLEVDLFVEIHGPPPRLVIVGAVHVAVALVTLAKTVGCETLVVDPRTAFATAERFAHADRLVHDWPDEALRRLEVDANTFVVLLSHDLKLDIPALEVALPRARYVGALGSKKTHARRLARLADAGVPESLWPRIHNPIGLDLGGRRAEEIAVAVMAQIVAVSHGKDARPVPGPDLPPPGP